MLYLAGRVLALLLHIFRAPYSCVEDTPKICLCDSLLIPLPVAKLLCGMVPLRTCLVTNACCTVPGIHLLGNFQFQGGESMSQAAKILGPESFSFSGMGQKGGCVMAGGI